jgi:hypothetical protein
MQNSLSHTSSKKYVALSMWLLVACIFSSLVWQWITLHSSDKEFTEYAESLIRRSSIDRRPAKDIRTLMLIKAEQLSLPIQDEEIQVTGQGESLQTTIAYSNDIHIPLLNRALYRMQFLHNVRVKPLF